ncbi:polysaccharide export outer membrane protein [Shimia aestuarii]|uniref:Polysaccharide export outer membrane protein n=2 Tax=Shimia aestuarii TaxID=254406 RepID=A0A1I4Q1T4_9RHOB|nr:polysaccharide export outer membrane protein [Shimia aestuarii]
MEVHMKRMPRISKHLIIATMVATLGACGIPRPGPNNQEILSLQENPTTDTHVVFVDRRITKAVAVTPVSGFPSSLTRAQNHSADRIRPGDTLSVSIFENVDDGVLSRGGAGVSSLESLQVDEDGFIFIPYAGRIRAIDNSPERLRTLITSKLSTLTPEPQVLVRRAAGDDATVSVLGDGIASQGVYPLQRSNRRLMEMLANAGGIAATPETTRVIVLRNQTKGEIWFEDIYDNPAYDIALQAGDRVVVERDPRMFTVLGATSKQANVPFEKRELSALEAVAQVGGLDGRTANPTGFFVIREQGPQMTNKVLGRHDLAGNQTVVYVINLTEPAGLPLAQAFDIRDGDTIYVTEAPFTQWTKTLDAITGTTRVAATFQAAGF